MNVRERTVARDGYYFFTNLSYLQVLDIKISKSRLFNLIVCNGLAFVSYWTGKITPIEIFVSYLCPISRTIMMAKIARYILSSKNILRDIIVGVCSELCSAMSLPSNIQYIFLRRCMGDI
jgi:hypothetical protein